MPSLSRLLRYSGLGILVVVIAIGPFFRGLFFWTELLASIAAISVGFGLWLTGRWLEDMPGNLLGGVPGVALIALLACYLVQFSWAVYPRGNLDWVLRCVVAVLVYVMVRAEAGPALRRWLGWALVLSATGMSVMGFLEFAGFFAKDPEMMAALGLVSLQDRMATPLQYPNTAAAYLLAALFAAAGLALEDLKRWKLVCVSGLITLISLAFFFTVSRGAVVVLPIGLLLFFVGLDRDKRWPGILLLIAAWSPTFAFLRTVASSVAASHWLGALTWVGTAAAAGAAAGLALNYFLRLRIRAQVATLVIGITLVTVTAIAMRPADGLFPKQLTRLLDMNLRTSSVIARLTFNRDALEMTMDRPLGRGGWGWDRSYRQYQETYYVARETHNHYFQTAAEGGVLGLLALLTSIITGFWNAWVNRRSNAVGWSLASGASLIAGHSLIDFNLSYGLVWLFLWGAYGAAASQSGAGKPGRIWQWLMAGVTVSTALTATLLGIGSWYADRAEQLVSVGSTEAARSTARLATRFDPLNSAPYLAIGDVAALQRAAELDPYLTNPHWELAILYENREEWESAHREARLTLMRHPLVASHYTKLASIAGTRLNGALHDGNTDLARELAQELNDLGSAFLRRKEAASKSKGAWMGPPLSMNPVFQLRYGQALFLRGELQEAIPYLTASSGVGLLASEADVFLYAIYEQLGDSAAMKQLESKPWIRFRNANPSYKVIRNWQP